MYKKTFTPTITFLPLLLLSILYFLSSFLSVNFGLSIQRGFIIFFTVILMLVFYDLGRQDEDNLLLKLIKLFLILNVGAIFLSFFYTIFWTINLKKTTKYKNIFISIT